MTGSETLTERFLSELERIIPRNSFRVESTDGVVVTIPARDAEVGAITVWLDDDEITVEIGVWYHCHFEVAVRRAPTLVEREQAAVETAVDYLRDIFSDQVRFLVWSKAGRCLGGSSWYPRYEERPHLFSEADVVQEVVWSHRVS